LYFDDDDDLKMLYDIASSSDFVYRPDLCPYLRKYFTISSCILYCFCSQLGFQANQSNVGQYSKWSSSHDGNVLPFDDEKSALVMLHDSTGLALSVISGHLNEYPGRDKNFPSCYLAPLNLSSFLLEIMLHKPARRHVVRRSP
jgi:hypothetical protein